MTLCSIILFGCIVRVSLRSTLTMQQYYSSLPWNFLESFLTCNGRFPLARREIAVRWGGDVWKRYETFNNLAEARRYMTEMGYESHEEPQLRLPLRFGSIRILRDYLVSRVPHAVDLGPVYPSVSMQSIDRKDPYAPKYLPLVFDVDIGAYDDMRPCACRKKELCDECWIVCIRPGLVDLLRWLRDFCGFERILTVFSGRAGYHVTVWDDRVWTWSQEARNGIVMYLPRTVRIDLAAMQIGHMLKMPYSPHASTKKAAWPILDPEGWVPSGSVSCA